MKTPEIIAALDFSTADLAREWLKKVPDLQWIKVGLELTLADPSGVEALVADWHSQGKKVFLDLKLHDIPNTVAGAIQSLGARFAKWPGCLSLLTLHALGGVDMMAAAKKARDESFGASGPALLGVTVLTSHSDEEVAQSWAGGEDRAAWVRRLAAQAAKAGIEGLVSSVHEAPLVGEFFATPPLIITPGIRWDDQVQDQKAVASPSLARSNGATHLVVGRPLTQAADPQKALATCLEHLKIP